LVGTPLADGRNYESFIKKVSLFWIVLTLTALLYLINCSVKKKWTGSDCFYGEQRMMPETFLHDVLQQNASVPVLIRSQNIPAFSRTSVI
jgi:hypothetical protein